MIQLGRLVAAGRTSDVYEFGRGSVVKVPRSGVPAHWAALEAEITAAVHGQGLPTPEVRGLEQVEGRDSVVFEHIEGPSLWEQIRAGTADVSSLAAWFAEIQLSIHAAEPPPSLLGIGDRVCQKIDSVGSLSESERGDAHRIVSELPNGTSLCHGDLHPGNVLMSQSGPIVIDWFDAAIGSSLADIVRSSLLIRPITNGGGHLHLPGSTAQLLERMHVDYLECVLQGQEVEPQLIRQWEAVLAVSRLAERAEPDEARLVALWQARAGKIDSPLVEAISNLGDKTADGRFE